MAKHLIHSQSGAMFGMDARIALIIASVLAATGATTMMSKLDRSRVDNAERGVQVIHDAIESHYKLKGINTLARDIDTLFQDGFLTDTSLLTDPWGATWEYKTTYKDIRMEDVPVRLNMAILYSYGKDGVDDSPPMITAADWQNWTAGGDDIAIKFNSIEIEKERLEEYRQRGKMIIDKLHANDSGKYIEADNTCNSEPTLDWCSRSNTPNFTILNYYPISDLDGSDAYYYDEVAETGSKETFISGNKSSMEQLMTRLSLPRTYATDPWGRILCYHSNIDQTRPVVNRPPFTASIWYAEDGLCGE